MKLTRKRIVLFFAIIVLIVGFVWYQDHNIKKIAHQGYYRFYNQTIKGKITDHSSSGGLDFFKIDDVGKNYAISPIPLQENSKTFFYNTAEIGDSIFKYENTDTFRLVKDGRVYYFTCHKY